MKSYPISPLMFNTMLNVPTSARYPQKKQVPTKERKIDITIAKEKVK